MKVNNFKFQTIIDEFSKRMINKTEFPSEFLEYFPTSQDFNDQEEEDFDYESEEDEYEWNSEDELSILSQEFGVVVGDNEDSNVSTDDWVDFYNALIEAGW